MRALQIMPYTTIFFFDQDRRYDTHMKWEQKPFDLHTLLQITDSLIYRDKLLQPSHISPREAIHNTLVIFIGIWQTEIAGLLKDVSNSAVEVDNMLENTYFYKCKLLLEQMSQTFADLENKVEADDYRIFMEKRERFISIISASCGIMTKLQ